MTATVAVTIVVIGVALALRSAMYGSGRKSLEARAAGEEVVVSAGLPPSGRPRAGIRVTVSIGATAIVLPVLLALAGTDYVLTRNVILAWLPLAVVVVAGLTWTGACREPGNLARRAGTAALGVLAVLGLASTIGVAFVGEWQREDWRGAADAIGPPAARAILVTEPSQATPVALYRERAALPEGDPLVVEEVVALARRDADDDHALAPTDDVIFSLGLRIEERRVEPTYELLRLVPETGPAVPLLPEQALTLGLDVSQRPSALLVEPAAGEPAPSAP